MNRTRKYLAAAGIAGILAAGATIPAIAQDAPADTQTEHDTREERHAERQERFAEALAEELGLDTGTVSDAIDAVKEDLREEVRAARLAQLEERLDGAVADGELTQDQADAILAAAEAGVLPGRGGRGGHGHGPGPGGPGAGSAGTTAAA